MFIQTSQTPNPETLKFMPGVEVISSGTKNFKEGDDLFSSPMAQRLFKIEGVKGVFLAADFITVTKDIDAEWDYLKPIVLASIMDHYVSGLPIITEVPMVQEAEYSDDVTKQIVEIIETRVRPAVAEDGGDIIFKEFKDGIVYLEMHGACSGCPSSTVTLKNGIENMLKHYVPEVIAVEQA
jgi:Fe-S cluster biogenesis protein NfuA